MMRANGQEQRTSGKRSWGTPGLVAAAAITFCLAAAVAFRLPLFFGADERPHFSYTVKVIQGDLPKIHDELPASDERFPVIARSLGLDDVPKRDREGTIFVANHPPLFYTLAAGPVWLASNTSSDVVAPLTLRLVNAAFMSVGVLLTGMLAMELFRESPHRRQLGLLAAAIAALIPNVVGVASYGHNDGLGLALTAAALTLVVRLLRRGPDAKLIVLAASVGSACLLSRVSLVAVVGALVLGTVVGGLRQDHRPWGLGRAFAAGGIVGLVPVLLSAWFYTRNQDLYGSLTGDSFNLEELGWEPRGSLWETLTMSDFHSKLWTELLGSVHPRLRLAERGAFVALLVALVLVGLVVRLARTRGRGDRAGIGIAGWLVLAGYVSAVTAGVADHVSKGGSTHTRYFLLLVPLVSVLLARSIEALPGWRVAGVALLSVMFSITAGLLLRYGDLISDREDRDQLLLPGGPASPVLTWIAVGLAVVAFTWVLFALLGPVSWPRRGQLGFSAVDPGETDAWSPGRSPVSRRRAERAEARAGSGST